MKRNPTRSLNRNLSAKGKRFKTAVVRAGGALCVIAIAFVGFSGCRARQDRALPPIGGLDDLPLVEVADFTQRPELASAASAIATDGDRVFFFDSRLKQLFRSSLVAPKIVPVGRSGEGPGEYAGIRGLILEDGRLYALDAARKMIAMDANGGLIWEEKTSAECIGLVGKTEEAFFFAEMRFDADGRPMLALTAWTRGQGSRLLCEKPIVSARGYAIYKGKLIEGGGIFFLANPAYATHPDGFLAAAAETYQFEMLDRQGKARRALAFRAPDPEVPEEWKGYSSAQALRNYAIAKFLPFDDGFYVLSNYHRDGKTRIDGFTRRGDLSSSHLLPLPFQPPAKDVFIQGHLLFYCDQDESGFRAFRWGRVKGE